MSATRREPVRTCVGCRERADRSALMRVVLGPDGLVRADATGRAPGRGAYVHREASCIEAAIRRGALLRALRADRTTATGPVGDTGADAGRAARLLEVLRAAAAQ